VNGAVPVVIGGGPAGLAAAHALALAGRRPVVLEAGPLLGGLARTEVYRGYRFDIGGHRFYTRNERIRLYWDELMGGEFRRVNRLSHIYYRRRFFNYPLEPFNALRHLGLAESTRVVLSYLRAKIRPHADESTMDRWLSNRFGERLFRMFFATYTEKVWGLPCSAIQAEWASQRIRGLSLRTAVTNALFGSNGAKTLIRTFDYPPLGPGQMWDKIAGAITAAGGTVRTGRPVVGLRWSGGVVREVVARSDAGTETIPAGPVISTMPLGQLPGLLDPPAPPEVLAAAGALSYRSFILVGLIVDRPTVLRDNWIYVHEPEVRVGRIQFFRNWSADLVPDPARGSVGMEYFCREGDPLWNSSDAELVALAGHELAQLNLLESRNIVDGVVYRQPHAYPVYDGRYRECRERVQRFLAGFGNLQSIGRNGTHQYNNMDHSMWMGLAAADRLLHQGEGEWREPAWSEDLDAGSEYA